MHVVNAAIIGLGWWGKNIVNAVQGKSTQLKFVRGVTKEIAETQAFAAQHGIPLCSELADVLADPEIEAVVLATPHSLHADQIVAAARAGKHVFCEKPLSLKRADAERAVKACLEAKRVIGVGQNKRFWPSMTALRGVAAGGSGTTGTGRSITPGRRPAADCASASEGSARHMPSTAAPASLT